VSRPKVPLPYGRAENTVFPYTVSEDAEIGNEGKASGSPLVTEDRAKLRARRSGNGGRGQRIGLLLA